MRDSLHKTLIIRFSSVGDIVLSSLLVRVLRKRFPESQIDFCIKEEFADLIRYNPHVTNVLEFPGNGSVQHLKQLRARVKHSNYDVIIDIHDSVRSRFICFGQNVVRVRKRKLARYLLVKFGLDVYRESDRSKGLALRYLEPAEQFGVKDDGIGLELFFPDEDAATVRTLVEKHSLSQGDRFIGVCPSAKHNNKMWLKERFAEAAASLSKGTHPIVLFGSENERERCEDLHRLIRSLNPTCQVMNLAGKITLIQTAALMDYCSIILTNDSGLMHIAAARKRNVVAVFGPTVKQLGFFPFRTNSIVVENNDLRCRPCTHIGLDGCPKGHFRCMKDIATLQIVNAANSLLQSPQS